ncbi:MAG: 5-carboxymethyl-2-hydroxymuconate isomerase [Xanthobacteraceae bacterium]|nr:5-carboxymethyl-2-hydroxymuconate isomerase [Xanthobacteraceae bacterium]MCW5673484.1 5-carboxymethyl-2-hydroxymuconate isomerase [Xanthobacteraceae bacterium]
MPHFVIEYSANLEPDVDLRAVVDAVHKSAVDSGLFKIGGIRVRTLRHEIYKIADGNPEHAFLHVRANILEGRSVEDRERLGNAMIAAVDALLGNAHKKRGIALSVEIGEIDHNMSFKKNSLHAQLANKGGAA